MASYVIWSCCWAYWRSMTTMFLLPTSQSPMDETRIVQRRDQPTLRCSCYWAYWRSMTTMFLLQTSQSPMDETRIVQRRDQPTLRCSYFSRRMGPVDATRFKRRDQPHREWLISTESTTMFLLQTSGGIPWLEWRRTFCCRSLRWRQFALMLQR